MTKTNNHNKEKNSNGKISALLIIFYMIIITILLSIPTKTFHNSKIYRAISIATDTLISPEILTYIIFNILFFIFFIHSYRNLRKTFFINANKFYIGLVLFLILITSMSFLEVIFSKNITIINIFQNTSYRIFLTHFLFCLLVAFTEELMIKGLLLTQILLRIENTYRGKLKAIILVSILFALMHLPGKLDQEGFNNQGQLFATFIFSFATSVIYIKTKNFPLMIFLHFFANIPSIFLEERNNIFYFGFEIIIVGFFSFLFLTNYVNFVFVKKFPNPNKAILLLLVLPIFTTAFIPKKNKDYFNLANDYSHIYSNTKALKYINLAIQENQNDKRYYFVRGHIHFELKEYLKSWKDYDKSFKIDPTDFHAIKRRGYASIELGNLDDGIADINISINEGIESSMNYEYRGRAYAEKNELEQAIKDLKYSLVLDQENEFSYFELGLAYYKYQTFDSSLHYLNKIHKNHKTYIKSLEYKSRIYSKMKQYESSNNLITEALSLDSTNKNLLYLKGTNLYYQKNYTESLNEFKKCVQYKVNEPRLFYYLGHTYILTGNKEMGCAILSNLIKSEDIDTKVLIETHCKL